MSENRVYYNGRIHTENRAMPQAQAMVVSGSDFAFVGSNEDALAFAGDDAQRIDLEGRSVLPGFFDGHIHPLDVANTSWHVNGPITMNKDELLANIRKAADENPKDKVPFLYYDSFFAETFGPKGPTKEELDAVVSDRPVRVEELTDFSCWYNSMALDMLRDENGVPQGWGLCRAEFVQDENGEYTGWCKANDPGADVAIYEAVGFTPPTVISEESIQHVLGHLRRNGVVGLMDGWTTSEENLKVIADLDRAGKLNMYYEAVSYTERIEDLEDAITTLRDWQAKYTTEHVRCNVVKFFMDGFNEVGGMYSTEPLRTDPTGTDYGQANATPNQLRDAMVRLNEEGIDFHVHCIGDGSVRSMLDAVEQAKAICGDDWRIKVCLAHCELIAPEDVPRIPELGVYLDWSAQWSGGYHGDRAKLYYGEERWERMYDFSDIVDKGDILGFSTDLYQSKELQRADPYFGIQCAMTRVDPLVPLDPAVYPDSVRPTERAKFTLDQLVHGYTFTNAVRMRLDNKAGSIEAGKKANFVIFDDDFFAQPADSFKDIRVNAAFFEGVQQ